MTADLVQWLTAQLDEDERIARAACKYASPEWHLDDEFGETVLWWPPEFHTPYEQDKHWRGQALDGHLAPHIAGHDPARVLREVEAKRVMATVIAPAQAAALDAEHGCCHEGGAILAGDCPNFPPSDLPLLRLLALPYADRDGYQEAWRP